MYVVGTRYMVVDCGGGTVDITVYEMLSDSGKLKELYMATGGPYGSTGMYCTAHLRSIIIYTLLLQVRSKAITSNSSLHYLVNSRTHVNISQVSVAMHIRWCDGTFNKSMSRTVKFIKTVDIIQSMFTHRR